MNVEVTENLLREVLRINFTTKHKAKFRFDGINNIITIHTFEIDYSSSDKYWSNETATSINLDDDSKLDRALAYLKALN